MNAEIGKRMSGKATVRIPAGKSVSHRYLIAASLAKGRSVIRNLSHCDDVIATANCLKAAGTLIVPRGDYLEVRGGFSGEGKKDLLLDARESGTTLRLLIPVLMNGQRTCVWTGKGRLMDRPLDVYESLFREHGVKYRKEGKILEVRGNLTPGEYVVPGNVSSQFISGLLLALPLLKGDSVIRITGSYESSSYVHMTESVMAAAGVVTEEDSATIRIPGEQKYKPIDVKADGDDSSAAFFGVLAAITKCTVCLTGISHTSMQADHVFLKMLERTGCQVEAAEDGYRIRRTGSLVPLCENLSDCPDLGPVMFALAAYIPGTSVFTGVRRLRLKESDRIAAMKEELTKLGAKVIAEEDTVRITGSSSLKGSADLQSHNDHRIVMALAVLSAGIEDPCVIHGADCVSKSFPDFFNRLDQAGVEVKWHDQP